MMNFRLGYYWAGSLPLSLYGRLIYIERHFEEEEGGEGKKELRKISRQDPSVWHGRVTAELGR